VQHKGHVGQFGESEESGHQLAGENDASRANEGNRCHRAIIDLYDQTAQVFDLFFVEVVRIPERLTSRLRT